MRTPGRILLIVSLCLLLSGHSYGQLKENITRITVKNTLPCTCNLATSLTSIQNTSSCDASDGSIEVTISGGSGNYNFTWSDQSGNIVGTTRDINNLRTGYYFLTVKDNDNPECSGQGFFEIGSDLTIQFSTETNESCILPTGSINATVSGGSGNFSYLWTYPDGSKVSQQNIAGLKGGQYLLRVTDNIRSCVISKSVIVKNPANLTVTVNNFQPSTSCTTPNGGLDVSLSGGSGQYAYYWYDVKNGGYVGYLQDLSNSKPGQYSLYVVDQVSGCVAYEFFDIIDETQKPVFTTETDPNTRCSAPFNGAIRLTLTGSPGPYSVSWTTETSTLPNNQNPSGLAPGKYGFTVTDNTTGCQASSSISDPQAITIEDTSEPLVVVSVDNITDNGDCSTPNGSANVTITTPNSYAVSWTGPNGFTSDDEDIVGLAAGVYELHVLTSCTTNHPPVIDEGPIAVQPKSQIEIQLLDYISDPDGNLDVESIEIIEGPGSHALWSVGQGNSIIIDYRESSFTGDDFITVRACDMMGACTIQQIKIEVGEGNIIVYNAVAPHSNGDNKFMRIMNMPAIHNKVSIFNRWGDKVFEVDDYSNNIPGKRFEGISINGNELPSGTYFYKIEFSDGKETLTGYLALKQ